MHDLESQSSAWISAAIEPCGGSTALNSLPLRTRWFAIETTILPGELAGVLLARSRSRRRRCTARITTGASHAPALSHGMMRRDPVTPLARELVDDRLGLLPLARADQHLVADTRQPGRQAPARRTRRPQHADASSEIRGPSAKHRRQLGAATTRVRLPREVCGLRSPTPGPSAIRTCAVELGAGCGGARLRVALDRRARRRARRATRREYPYSAGGRMPGGEQSRRSPTRWSGSRGSRRHDRRSASAPAS